jgi:uncharacterized membrane protein
VKFLTERDMLLELNHRPGRYLVKGVEIGTLHYNDDFEENDEENILKQFIIGKTKTPQQDLEYSVNQMVQIAARALSPGVNDPYTAIACIDNLTATMCYLAEAKFPSKYRYDEDEHLRIIADVLDFEGILDASFNQIRQYSGGNNAVIIRLMEAMIVIYGFTNINTSKKAVLKHAQMILNIGERTMDEANDIQDLTERSNKILNNN